MRNTQTHRRTILAGCFGTRRVPQHVPSYVHGGTLPGSGHGAAEVMQTAALGDDRDGREQHQQPPEERHVLLRPMHEDRQGLGGHKEKVGHDERMMESGAAETPALEELEDVRQEERDAQNC